MCMTEGERKDRSEILLRVQFSFSNCSSRVPDGDCSAEMEMLKFSASTAAARRGKTSW